MDTNYKQAYMIEVSEYVLKKAKDKPLQNSANFRLRVAKGRVVGYLNEHCPIVIRILRKLKVDVLFRHLIGGVDK